MFWYSVFFQPNDSGHWLPVYEDHEGRYWLGGSRDLLSPLIFVSKRDAEKAIVRIRQVELTEGAPLVWKNGVFAAKRFQIVAHY